jgi:hypothetical protein
VNLLSLSTPPRGHATPAPVIVTEMGHTACPICVGTREEVVMAAPTARGGEREKEGAGAERWEMEHTATGELPWRGNAGEVR